MKNGVRMLLLSLAVIGVVAVIAFTLLSNKRKAALEIQKDTVAVPFTVSAALVKEESFNSNQGFRGRVEAKSIVTIFSEADGKLISNSIEKGRYVRKGQVVAVVDKTIRAATNQMNIVSYDKAKADFEIAQRNNERYETLLKENNATVVEAENAKLQLKAAEMQLQSIQQQISISRKQIQQTTILAPASGVIIDKKSYSGDFVQPGAMLGTIADLNVIVVKVFVPETFVVKLKIGTSVNITADVYAGMQYTGVVKTIIPVANEAKAFPVEIEIANNKKQQLMAGMSMSVLFEPSDNTAALVIPRTALSGNAKSPHVFVIGADKKPVKKQIMVGRDFGTMVEIISGLSKDEIVITSGQANIEQGKVLTEYTLVQ
jgi:RND family efflux transporter MFP subunit